MRFLGTLFLFLACFGGVAHEPFALTEAELFYNNHIKMDTSRAAIIMQLNALKRLKSKLVAEKEALAIGLTTCSQKQWLYSPEDNTRADADKCVPFPCYHAGLRVEHGNTIDKGCPSGYSGTDLYKCNNGHFFSYSNTCALPPPPPPPPKNGCGGSMQHGDITTIDGGCRTMRCDDGALLEVSNTCAAKPKDCYGGAAGVIPHGQSASIPCPSYAPVGEEVWACNDGVGTRVTYTCHKPEPEPEPEPEGYWYPVYKYTTCIQGFSGGIRSYLSKCKYHGDWHDYECRGGICTTPKPSPYCTIQESGGKTPC